MIHALKAKNPRGSGLLAAMVLLVGASAQAQTTDGAIDLRRSRAEANASLWASSVPYVEVTSGALMIHAPATSQDKGVAARIIGVSRHGSTLYLLDEFRRGAAHGTPVPFSSNARAELARRAILSGQSIDVSRCIVRPGRKVSAGPATLNGRGELCREVVRQPTFQCRMTDRTPIEFVGAVDYELAPLSEWLSPQSRTECDPGSVLSPI
jgi:hypothetical protein